MTKPRPTLDSLSSRFAKKDAPIGAVASTPEPFSPPPQDKAEAAALLSSKKDTRVQILTRIDAATRKRLKMIAVEQDRTIQDICEQAIHDFIARHSR